MCHLKIDVYQCGHKRKSIQVGGEYSLTRYNLDLARLSCVVKAKKNELCHPDNQVIDYEKHPRGERCEVCLIRILYEQNLRDFGLEYEMANKKYRIELEDQALQEAKDAVGDSPLIKE